jgi:hypothetical protein
VTDRSAAPQPDLDEDRQAALRTFAPAGVALLAFAIAATTVPFQTRPADDGVLLAVAALVVLASRIGGNGGGISVALLGGLSVDFFHRTPIRTLHPRALVPMLVLLCTVGVISARSRRASPG